MTVELDPAYKSPAPDLDSLSEMSDVKLFSPTWWGAQYKRGTWQTLPLVQQQNFPVPTLEFDYPVGWRQLTHTKGKYRSEGTLVLRLYPPGASLDKPDWCMQVHLVAEAADARRTIEEHADVLIRWIRQSDPAEGAWLRHVRDPDVTPARSLKPETFAWMETEGPNEQTRRMFLTIADTHWYYILEAITSQEEGCDPTNLAKILLHARAR